MYQHLERPTTLILYTVIYGHPQFLVFRAINTIWLFSMIALIIYGRFL
jgi:hypothetical protein